MLFLFSGASFYFYYPSPHRICPPPAGDGLPLKQ
jgi:hypothetical protein